MAKQVSGLNSITLIFVHCMQHPHLI